VPLEDAVKPSEPLRWLLHPLALLAFAAAAQAWIDGADVRAIVTAVLGVLIAGATEAARAKVKPVADLPAADVNELPDKRTDYIRGPRKP
jgi:hypothetical protein